MATSGELVRVEEEGPVQEAEWGQQEDQKQS